MYAVKIDPKRPDKKIIAEAADTVKKGGLVVFPTETVYGIAASLLDDKAITRLYKIKKGRRSKPFTVHISDIKMIEKMGCKATGRAKALIDRFWPGPLTIILKSENGETIGFRMPANRIALEFIKAVGAPIVAPSANLSGKDAPTSAKDAFKDLEGRVDMVLDAGLTDIGLESTVIDLSAEPPKVLREGAIKAEDLKKYA